MVSLTAYIILIGSFFGGLIMFTMYWFSCKIDRCYFDIDIFSMFGITLDIFRITTSL